MTSMENQSFACPQLLPEKVLRELLQNSCIEVPNFDAVDKVKLIEIFKRVALPMPQRKYSNKPLGKRLQNLRLSRGVRIVDYDQTNVSSCTAAGSPRKLKESPNKDSKTNGRLKPPLDDLTQVEKKIRLSSDGEGDATPFKNEVKRKCENPTLVDSKKRQKITWP